MRHMKTLAIFLTSLAGNQGASFDGKHFKIVLGKSNEPISFGNEQLKLRAASVYYHLTKARKFWIDEFKSSFVKNMEKLTIRLEITNTYSEIAHYKNDNVDPSYNNAYTVSGGKTPDWVPEDKQDEWGMEIWFNPSKKIAASDLESEFANPLEASLEALKAPVVEIVRDSFSQSLLNSIFFSSYSTPLRDSVIRHAGTLALFYGVAALSKKADPLFMEDFYYLDTAMVPEIVYHEFSHAALSNWLEPTHATPVIEGMADFFATLTENDPVMYRKIYGYSVNVEKNALNQTLYHPVLEQSWKATGDFVLSLLWKVRGDLILAGVDEKLPQRLVLHSAQYLNTADSTVARDLTRALFRSCQEICSRKNRRVVMQTLLRSFEYKGL